MTLLLLPNRSRLLGLKNTLTILTAENGKIFLNNGKYGGKLVFTCNLNKLDTSKLISVQDPFLLQTLEIWSEVNFDEKIETEQKFFEQHVWHNSLIRIENRPVFYKHIFLYEITKVAQLITDSRSFLPLADFINTYNIRIQLMKYFGLISALRHYYNTNFLGKNLVVQTLPIPSPRLLLRTIKRTELYTRSSSLSKVPFLIKGERNGMIVLNLMKDVLLTRLAPIVRQFGAQKAQNS